VGNVLRSQGRDVVVPLRVRPVAREDASGVWVALDLEHRLGAEGALEAQFEPADACEEAGDPGPHG